MVSHISVPWDHHSKKKNSDKKRDDILGECRVGYNLLNGFGVTIK